MMLNNFITGASCGRHGVSNHRQLDCLLVQHRRKHECFALVAIRDGKRPGHPKKEPIMWKAYPYHDVIMLDQGQYDIWWCSKQAFVLQRYFDCISNSMNYVYLYLPLNNENFAYNMYLPRMYTVSLWLDQSCHKFHQIWKEIEISIAGWVLSNWAQPGKIQWNLSITTTLWDTSLPSGAHLGGQGPPRWAPEGRNC